MNDAGSFGLLDGPEAGGNSPVPPSTQSPRVSGGGGRGNGRRKLVKGRGSGRQRRSPRPKQTFVNNPVEYLEDNVRGGRTGVRWQWRSSLYPPSAQTVRKVSEHPA